MAAVPALGPTTLQLRVGKKAKNEDWSTCSTDGIWPSNLDPTVSWSLYPSSTFVFGDLFQLSTYSMLARASFFWTPSLIKINVQICYRYIYRNVGQARWVTEASREVEAKAVKRGVEMKRFMRWRRFGTSAEAMMEIGCTMSNGWVFGIYCSYLISGMWIFVYS